MDAELAIRLERIRQWKAGVVPGPLEIIISPTLRCNLSCAICWRQRTALDMRGPELNGSRDEVPDARLLRLVDEAAAMGVKQWVIVGGGDPLMRATLFNTLSMAIASHGMRGILHTNGVRLDEALSRRLVDSHWEQVVVSLDGPDRETNDAIRSAGSFRHATENLARLAAIRKEAQTHLPRVTMHTVITNRNVMKLDAMVALADDLGCDEIGFYHLIDEGASSTALLLTDDQWLSLPEHFGRAGAVADRIGIAYRFPEMNSGRSTDSPVTCSVPSGATGLSAMRNAACFEPWTSIMITADGHVGPCCVFWDPEAQRIQDHSLEEIWNGPYFQKIREQVCSDSLMPYCTQCPDSLKTRSQALRLIMQWEEASPLAKGAMLGKRFFVALREKGVKYVFVRSLQRLRQRFPFQSALEP